MWPELLFSKGGIYATYLSSFITFPVTNSGKHDKPWPPGDALVFYGYKFNNVKLLSNISAGYVQLVVTE